MYVDTLDENSDSLKKLLSLIEFSDGDFLNNYPKRLRSLIINEVRERNFDIMLDIYTFSYFLSKEDALKLEKV